MRLATAPHMTRVRRMMKALRRREDLQAGPEQPRQVSRLSILGVLSVKQAMGHL